MVGAEMVAVGILPAGKPGFQPGRIGPWLPFHSALARIERPALGWVWGRGITPDGKRQNHMKLHGRWMAALLGLALAGGMARAEEAKKDAAKPETVTPDPAKTAKMGPKKVLEEFDKNGDGKITGAEAEALRKAFAGARKAQLERYDKDGNGKLDDSEIAAIKSKKATKKAAADAKESPAKTTK